MLGPPPLFHLLHAVDQDKKSQNVAVRLSQTSVRSANGFKIKDNGAFQEE